MSAARYPRLVLIASLLALRVSGALLPLQPVSLSELDDFEPAGANWSLAGGIAGDPRRTETFTPVPGVGLLVNTAPAESGEPLFSVWQHGDLDLEVEFLLPKGSNSGVYFQSRYEVQLFDSWGVAAPTFSDVGGIYQRWDEAAQRGFEGHAPRRNAARAPGLWQQLRVSFRAPRFDASGQKIANARFAEVVLNGLVIHRDVELTGPTRAAARSDEAPLGALMLQGDHGPVAFRNLRVKRYEGGAVHLEDLRYELYAGPPSAMGTYSASALSSAGPASALAPAALDRTDPFALVYFGQLNVPRTGTYAFAASGNGATRLLVGDQVALAPLPRGAQPRSIHLTAGVHPFQLDFLHARVGTPALELRVEGPAMFEQILTPVQPEEPEEELLIQPEAGQVRVQRGFVPFPPIKRLYAISVGHDQRAHYAYDLERAALLRGWDGDFLDVFQMWDGRGYSQLARPAGPTIDFGGAPTIALLPSPQADWPETPDALFTSHGYELDERGQPVFLATLDRLKIRDRAVPTSASRGLERVIELEGRGTDWLTFVLLASGSKIEAQPDGSGYIIDDRRYYLDLPPDPELVPSVRTRAGRQELVVLVPNPSARHRIHYTLVW